MTRKEVEDDALRRRPGRPRKNDPPAIPIEEVDRLLVHGEVVVCKDGTTTTTVYPTYREVAERYGVAHSLIAGYARRHDCMRRRKSAQVRAEVQADERLIERRAEDIAVTKDEQILIIDDYIRKFRQALEEGRIRFDSPADFNMMVRLREFLQGGPDSRQETNSNVVLTLDAIQERYQRSMQRHGKTNEQNRSAVIDVADTSAVTEGTATTSLAPVVAPSTPPNQLPNIEEKDEIEALSD